MKQLSDLAFFSELVRHESLASAAMAFDVTPPAVSRRLAALEKGWAFACFTAAHGASV
ncbi:LysR family transcriptional regulator [Limnobacter sp. SAORIC-690]|uniref:helix-turn-helix domain-containing protein n=1 Tax=Limnobacter sp. SAORIC-690 TaxID=1923970 RepID=UPI001F0B7249|nr:LysR family transcriptional regulator [Limnobacter sp. SAORIC-690]